MCDILHKVLKDGLCNKVAFEQKSEEHWGASPLDIWGRVFQRAETARTRKPVWLMDSAW